MNIVIVGTGYVGLVTGVGFAEQGHTVSFIDLDSSKIECQSKAKRQLQRAAHLASVCLTSLLRVGISNAFPRFFKHRT